MTFELLPLRWIIFFMLLSTAQCTSFLVVTTGKAVCKSAELAKDTFVKILFEAPGMMDQLSTGFQAQSASHAR
jgi:hypothetical protein